MPRPLALLALLAACSGQAEVDDVAPSVGSPSIRIDRPDAAAFLEVGSHTLSGTATDLVSVEVTPAGGVINADDAARSPALLEGGTFTAEVTAAWGINAYEALGTDAGGDTWLARRSVMAGTFVPAQGPIERAAQVRIETDAFDSLANGIETALDPAALSKGIGGAPPVFEESFGILGLDAVQLSASVGSIDFGPPDLGIDPVPGSLVIRLVLPAVEIGLPVEGSIVGIGFDTEATIGCDQAIIAGALRVGTDGQGGLDLEVLDPTIELRGFGYDVSALPGDALEGLFTSSLRGILEAQLIAQVEAGLPTLLDAALAGLNTPTELPFLNTSAELTPGFRTALIDDDGLGLVLDLDVQVPIAGTKAAPGFLYRGDSLPPLTGTDLGMIVSDDLVNRVLHELWAGGVLDLRIESDEGLLDPALFEDFGGKNGGYVELEAMLPPVLIQQDGSPRLQVGEWLLRVGTPDGDNGEYVDFACALSAAIDLDIADGSLLGTVTDPQVSYIVRGTDWTARDETITRLVEGSLPVEDLLGLLGTLEFPLPTIGTFTFDDAAISRDARGASTTLALDL